MIEVEIDKGSGFCFGVVTAIESAERELKNTDRLYCLGDIVHNSLEVERLEESGLRTIEHDEFTRLKGEKVLLRAHGEPPSSLRDCPAEQHHDRGCDLPGGAPVAT